MLVATLRHLAACNISLHLAAGHDCPMHAQVVSSRDASRTAAAVAQLQERFPGRGVHGRACDVRDEAAVRDQRLLRVSISAPIRT